MTDQPQTAWDRWPGEPNKWFDRFRLYYLEQGPDRTLAQAQREWHSQQIAEGHAAPDSRPPRSRQWATQAARWQWQARAEAWDHQARLKRIAKAEAERESNRRQRIETLNGLLHKAAQALLELDPAAANWKDVTGAIKVAVSELGAEYGRAQAVDLNVDTGPQIPTGAATALATLDDDALETLIMALAQPAAAQPGPLGVVPPRVAED